jgi:hypothetical protein
MRPLSVVSDLAEAIAKAIEEAADCGLEYDQIFSVIRDEVADCERAWEAGTLMKDQE